MVWKQDLAKLKQQLGEAPSLPPPKPVPKPADKPVAPVDLNTEDALFLAAMGRRPPRPAPAKVPEIQAVPVEPPPPPPPPETFAEAVAELKGLKPLAPPAMRPKPAPPLPPRPAAPVPEAVSEPPPEPALPPPPPPEPALPPPLSTRPARFQLAAGMALEVDGVLDLRGHSQQDAIERLKDRLADGLLLGWRSIQVFLGTDPDLHEGLLTLLESGEAPMITRYAQAPVPMGGAQAWLLYFAPPT